MSCASCGDVEVLGHELCIRSPGGAVQLLRPQRLDEEADGLVEVGHGERDVVGVPDPGDAGQLIVGAARVMRAARRWRPGPEARGQDDVIDRTVRCLLLGEVDRDVAHVGDRLPAPWSGQG